MTNQSIPSRYAGLSATLEAVESVTRFIDEAKRDGYYLEGPSEIVATRGVAGVIVLDSGLEDPQLGDVAAMLGSIRHVDDPHSPVPLCIGSFPFERSGPTRLVIPREALVIRPGAPTWRIAVDGEMAVTEGPSDSSSQLVEDDLPCWLPSNDEYEAGVDAVLTMLGSGAVQKVVLARAIAVSLRRHRSSAAILAALGAGSAGRFGYSMQIPGGRLVGVSPELLIERHGRRIASNPFAGTVALSETLEPQGDLDRLIHSEKDRYEHEIVVRAIESALAAHCSTLVVPPEPTPFVLGDDARLGTLITGRLDEPPSDALSLLEAIHPTPAVGGIPRNRALEVIDSLEPHQRGHWAGAVGWSDARGDGAWILAIRNVALFNEFGLIHAGAGVVATSTPRGEGCEALLKLRSVLNALGLDSYGRPLLPEGGPP